MTNFLYDFTRAISSGITLFRTSVRNLLPNLYILNREESTTETPLIYDGDFPSIEPHSYGEYLDRLGEMFAVSRNFQENDEEYRRRILFSLQQNSTKSGIKSSIDRIFETYGINADVEVRESFSNAFDGTASTFDVPMRSPEGSLLYGISVIVTPRISTYNQVSVYNFSTFQKETYSTPSGSPWRIRKNVSVDRFVSAYRVPSFRFLIDAISSAGVRVDRVIVQESGSGGSKGEVYDYQA